MFGSETTTTTIAIAGGRICGSGSGFSSAVARTTIHAQGLTVLPGLIDGHVHLFPLGADGGIDSDATLDAFVRDELPARLEAYLRHGVTSLISVGDPWPAVRDLRERIVAGELSGPRLFMTGPILTAPGGYPAATICARSPWCASRLTVELRDEEHARETVRDLAAAGVDAIKVVFDEARRAVKLDPEIVRVVTNEAHAHGLPVIVHATEIDDVIAAVDIGVDVVAHLPAGGLVDEEVVSHLRDSEVTILSTAAVYAPVDGADGHPTTVFGLRYGPPFDKFHNRGLKNAAELLRRQVPLAFGSGTAMFTPPRSLDMEIDALGEVPLSGRQLLDAMTIHPARAIGKQADIGRIGVGQIADLVLVATDSDDMTEVMQHVVLVIKDGRVVVDRR